MDDREYLVILYDYYGELLNEMQRKCFEDYYFDNLSLAEISENDGKSRNAIHKQIKEVEEKLNYFEEKLNLLEKNRKISNLLKECSDEELVKKIENLI